MARGQSVAALGCAAAGPLVSGGANGVQAGSSTDVALQAAALHLTRDLPAARAMGLQARQTALGLDWGHIVTLVEQAYAEALQRGQPAFRPVLGDPVRAA